MGARRRIFRVAVIYWALLSVNELASNAFVLYTKFASKVYALKVLSAFTDTFFPAFKLLAPGLIAMLVIVALLSALVACGWAAATVLTYDALVERYRPPRAARMTFWFVCSLAFFNAYYSLHALLFPYSTISDTPLAAVCGALHFHGLASVSALVVAIVCALTVAAVLASAVWCSRAFRYWSGATLLAALVVTPAYGWLTGIGPVQRFTMPGSIVLLGLDSFQTNRLSSGGAAESHAPNIDALVEKSVLFDNAWTPFARTYPSWVSILTGRYPVKHGVRFNLVSDGHLAPDNRYLARELRDRGYQTFHATDETRFSNIRPLFGYQQLLHPPMGLPDFLIGTFFDFSTANFARQTHLGHDLFPSIRNNRALPSYNPRIFTRNLIKSLNRLPTDRPLFITMHLCGNHWPFTTPAPYWFHSDDPVHNAIRMVDDQVGEIVDYLRVAGLLDSATTFVLSDHGDGWSGDPEDVVNTHGDDLDHAWANRIVLAIHGLDREPTVSSDLVRSIDLYPTILELAGAPTVPDGIDGRSLLALLEGGDRSQRSVFAESGFDRLTLQAQRAVQEYVGWYGFDERTHLVTLNEDAHARLMKRKSYMLMRAGRRLVYDPNLQTVRLFAIDPATGAEQEADDAMASADKQHMLQELLSHYRLEARELVEIAAAGNAPAVASGSCERARCAPMATASE